MAPRTWRDRSHGGNNPHWAPCPHVCLPVLLISPRNGSLQLFDRDASPLHSYCKQTLRHAKLEHALAGSFLGSSRSRLASRRPRWDPRVTRTSFGRFRSPHIGGLEVWVNHHENRPIALTFLLVSLLNVKGLTTSTPPMIGPNHQFSAQCELRPSVRYNLPSTGSL